MQQSQDRQYKNSEVNTVISIYAKKKNAENWNKVKMPPKIARKITILAEHGIISHTMMAARPIKTQQLKSIANDPFF